MANIGGAILEEIKGLTLLEAADLVKKMEETSAFRHALRLL